MATTGSRSVAVQTEGRVSAYPQGSVWLDSAVGSVASSGGVNNSTNNKLLVGSGLNYPGAGTILKPSALMFNNNNLLSNSSVGFENYSSGSLLNDRSIDMHSMPQLQAPNPHSLWGPVGGGGLEGGNSLALTSSIASSEENYTIKSANYALQMPNNPANAKTKALAKIRKQKFGGSGGGVNPETRNSLGGSATMQFRDLDQIILDSSNNSHHNTGIKKKYLAVMNGSSGGGKQSQVMSVHQSLDDMPRMMHGSSSSSGGGGEGLQVTRSFNGGVSNTLRGAGVMSVSGSSAFAAGAAGGGPALLPKL